MLLFELSKEESKAFMRIVLEFVSIDNKVNREEKNIVAKYLSKLNLSREEANNLTVEEAKEILKNSEDKIKKMIYFDLLGVALIDGDYETSEIDFLDEIANQFNISRANKIVFANYYYELDNMKDKSEEEINEKLLRIIK